LTVSCIAAETKHEASRRVAPCLCSADALDRRDHQQNEEKDETA
jgi:hypothetical protein